MIFLFLNYFRPICEHFGNCIGINQAKKEHSGQNRKPAIGQFYAIFIGNKKKYQHCNCSCYKREKQSIHQYMNNIHIE